jgi:hypothetical protein
VSCTCCMQLLSEVCDEFTYWVTIHSLLWLSTAIDDGALVFDRGWCMSVMFAEKQLAWAAGFLLARACLVLASAHDTYMCCALVSAPHISSTVRNGINFVSRGVTGKPAGRSGK